MSTDELLWYTARASGLVAWALLSAGVLWGLALSTKVLGPRPRPSWMLDLHRFLGGAAVAFVGRPRRRDPARRLHQLRTGRGAGPPHLRVEPDRRRLGHRRHVPPARRRAHVPGPPTALEAHVAPRPPAELPARRHQHRAPAHRRHRHRQPRPHRRGAAHRGGDRRAHRLPLPRRSGRRGAHPDPAGRRRARARCRPRRPAGSDRPPVAPLDRPPTTTGPTGLPRPRPGRPTPVRAARTSSAVRH